MAASGYVSRLGTGKRGPCEERQLPQIQFRTGDVVRIVVESASVLARMWITSPHSGSMITN